MTYMFLAIVANAWNPHLTVHHSVLESLPTTQPSFLAAIRTVQQEKINVTQSALFHRLGDTLPHGLIACITSQLACVVNVFPLQFWVFLQVGGDGRADFALVVVHLRAVKGAVSCFESIAYGCAGFFAACEVDSEMDVRNREVLGVGEGFAGSE
jgi:hypothetical protein